MVSDGNRRAAGARALGHHGLPGWLHCEKYVENDFDALAVMNVISERLSEIYLLIGPSIQRSHFTVDAPRL